MAATLADVAKKAGCSSATVSRVLTGTGQISKPTRDAVLKAARTLNYQPRVNRRAASLDADHAAAGIVDVIVHRRSPFERLTMTDEGLQTSELSSYTREAMQDESNRLSNSFERGITDGLIDEASAWGYRVAMRTTSDLTDDSLLGGSDAGQDGVILMGEYSEGLAGFVDSCRRPLVLVDLVADGAPPVVTIDNDRGIGAAVDHLLELGHREIGFLAGPQSTVGFRERRSSFSAKMADAGLGVNRSWVYEGLPHMVHTAAWVEKLVSRKSRPTALMCGNDFMALAAMKAALSRGVSVPRQLSVVGFDDIEPSPLVTPALTTVRVPTLELGRQAIRQMMLEVRAGRPSRGVIVRVSPELVIRKSTAAPAR